jgi:hypothetical protein
MGMKKFEVWIVKKADQCIDIRAHDYSEAIEIAKDVWFNNCFTEKHTYFQDISEVLWYLNHNMDEFFETTDVDFSPVEAP